MNKLEKNEHASTISGQNETDTGTVVLESEYLNSVVKRARVMCDRNPAELAPVIEVQ